MTIKTIRQTTGLSQSSFAKKYDIPVRTLQQWEQKKSSPPEYVVSMLEAQVERDQLTDTASMDERHHVPPKSKWKICITDPFKNCERIYPIQQHKVKELICDITSANHPNEIWIFGSSTTEKCHIGSDIDIYVDIDSEAVLLTKLHDFEYDLWTKSSVDKRLLNEIKAKGVKVYG